MEQIKKIFITLIIFFTCFLVIDYIIGYGLDYIRHNLPMDGERTAKTEYVINRVNADILVIGSSRAQCHYDTYVLRDSLQNFTVFNCGGDGQKFWYCDIITNCILNRYAPKLIIWDFLLDDLESCNENLSLLYPYYNENDYIKLQLLERQPLLKYQLWLNSYRYNGSGARILTASRLPKEFGKDKLGYNGHKRLNTISLVCDDMHFKYTSPDNAKLDKLEKTIMRAKSKGTTIVFTVSPVINQIIGENTTIKTLEYISQKYHVQFINDSQLNGFVGNLDMGYDNNHLNSDAATLFTRKLINQLDKEGIQK